MGHPIVGWIVIIWGLISWAGNTSKVGSSKSVRDKHEDNIYTIDKFYGGGSLKAFYYLQLVVVGIEFFISFFLPDYLFVPVVGYILADIIFAIKYHHYSKKESTKELIAKATDTCSYSSIIGNSLSVASLLFAGFILI